MLCISQIIYLVVLRFNVSVIIQDKFANKINRDDKMKKLIIAIVLFAELIQLNAQQRKTSEPYPRLGLYHFLSPHFPRGIERGDVIIIPPGTINQFNDSIDNFNKKYFKTIRDSLPNFKVLAHYGATCIIGDPDISPMHWLFKASKCTLSVSVDADASSHYLYVSNANGFEEGEYIMIYGDREHMHIKKISGDGISPDTLWVTRGEGGTSPMPHNVGNRVVAHTTQNWGKNVWTMNISSACPEVPGKGKYANWLADNIKSEYNTSSMFDGTRLWDGIYLDLWRENVFGKWPLNGWDLDNDGDQESKDSANILWNEGLEYASKVIRDSINTLKDSLYFVHNDPVPFDQLYFNGRLFEEFPRNDDNWHTAMRRYHLSDTATSYLPRLLVFNGGDDSLSRDNYEDMRYCLTSALLGSAYFNYNAGDGAAGPTSIFWWYDEYSVDSSGTATADASCKGYLGMPVGMADSVPGKDVWYREFDKGISIVNPSSSEQTIYLPDLFGNIKLRRINGTQDANVNNGALQHDSLVLSPKKGLILLKDKFLVLIESEMTLPIKFVLYQNYPNPFNPSTKIKYSIPNSAKVLIKVYDVLGKEVKTLLNEFQNIGTHEIEFNASKLSSGLYFYRIISGIYSETRKMMLLR